MIMDQPFLDTHPRPPLSLPSVFLLNTIVALTYAMTGYAGLQLAFVGQAVTLFWPPSGIAFAALWIGGLRLIPGVALGALAVNMIALGAFPLALLVAIGNTLPALSAALALRHRLARYPDASELTRVLWFILIAALGSTTLSATVGTLAVGAIAGIGSSIQATWLVWWMGDAMGVLIAGLPILLWRRFALARITLHTMVDTLGFALAGFGIIAGLLVIDHPVWAVELCKLFTLLLSLWAGIRFGLNGPAAMTLLMALGAVSVTMIGAGPFARGSFYDNFALLHSYLFAEAVAGMLLAAALADLRSTAALEVRARGDAEAASANRIRLLTMISHDVRTPLAGISGVFDALAVTPLSSPQARLVELGQRAGQTLQTLTDDILDVARVDAGRITLNPQPFDLGQCLADIADTHRMSAKAKGLTIAVDLDGSLPRWQCGDRARIEQIVGNLVVNAVSYTETGHITLTASQADDGRTRITVSDTGPGVPPGAVARIADSFAFLPRPGSRSAGLGLGLHICHRLATLMEGTLRHEDVPAGGSRFTFEAPLPAGMAPKRVDPVASAPSLSILLVEDDPISREVTMALLGLHGHRITAATTEAEAVQLATAMQYDVVLMDLQLGSGGCGLAATRQIRASGIKTCMIGLTADGSELQSRAATDAGLAGLIIKPINLSGGLAAALDRAVFSSKVAPGCFAPAATQNIAGPASKHPA